MGFWGSFFCTILESKATEDREYKPLECITWDNYPKYILTIDNLLQKRSGNVHYNKGKWGMIANHVGVGQSLIDALIQKGEEEIGYEIDPSDVRYLTMLKRNDEREQRFTYFFLYKKRYKK